MKKILTILLLFVSAQAFAQLTLASEYPTQRNDNWRFKNNDTVTFNLITLQDKGRWLPNGNIDYIYGVGPYTWPSALSGTGTKYLSVDASTKVMTWSAGVGSGAITGLNDMQVLHADASGNIRQDANFYYDYVNDFLILNTTSSQVVTANSDLSLYARMTYNNIGLQGASHASNFTADEIAVYTGTHQYLNITPNPAAWDGYTHITNGNTDDVINWVLPTSQGAANTYFKNDGSGNLSWSGLSGGDLGGFSEYDVPYANSSGYLTSGLLHFDNSLYNFYFGTTNTESYNLNITEPTGRCEGYFTGYAAENKLVIRRANGTQASPTKILGGDAIGVIGMSGYDETNGFTSDVDAGMKVIAAEDWTSTAHGNYMLFAIKPTGSNTLSKMMRLDQTGLNVGAFGSHSYTLDVDGDINMTSGSHLRLNGTPVAKAMLAGMPAANVNASTTGYGPLMGQNSFSTTEAQRQMVMPFDGTLSNLYVVTASAQSGTGDMVVTVRKNGSATALTLTISAGSGAGVFSDTTHSFTFSAGDIITFQFANAASANQGIVSFSAKVY